MVKNSYSVQLYTCTCTNEQCMWSLVYFKTWWINGLLFQLRDLLEHGADILLPVKIKEEWKPGTVVDFAHEAFKQVHCL